MRDLILKNCCSIIGENHNLESVLDRDDNCLWVKMLKANYCLRVGFLDWDEGQSSSFVWSILSVKDLILKNCYSITGDEESTTIWKVHWLPHVPNRLMMPGEL